MTASHHTGMLGVMVTKTSRGNIKVTTELPEDVWEAMHMAAVRERTSAREILVAALRKHLRLPEPKGGKRGAR